MLMLDEIGKQAQSGISVQDLDIITIFEGLKSTTKNSFSIK